LREKFIIKWGKQNFSIQGLWMRTKKRSRVSSCLGLSLIVPLSTCLVLATAGLLYESTASKAAFQSHPPPGQLIDVGKYQLHIYTLGEDAGLPVVILDSGGMSMSAQWGWVMGSIARFTQVVAYDRPGMGWSEPSPHPIDADELIDHLRSALRETGLEGPYILVGHSMGGLTTRLFAQMYPDEVFGLVQVDPRDLLWQTPSETEIRLQTTIISALSRVGLIRLTGMAARDAEGLPPRHYLQAMEITSSHRHLRNAGSEAHLGDSATSLLETEEDLSPFPLIVLTATEPDGAIPSPLREELYERHAALAAQSPQGNHILVPGAGHVSIVTHENFAQHIITAITDLLEGTEN
jgi:pimeloyl-ACP methyl ester carboxylesterase